jgi:hypothetical protein
MYDAGPMYLVAKLRVKRFLVRIAVDHIHQDSIRHPLLVARPRQAERARRPAPLPPDYELIGYREPLRVEIAEVAKRIQIGA